MQQSMMSTAAHKALAARGVSLASETALKVVLLELLPSAVHPLTASESDGRRCLPPSRGSLACRSPCRYGAVPIRKTVLQKLLSVYA